MEYTHAKLGLRLVLLDYEELKQRYAEKFVAEMRKSELGDLLSEGQGKTLRAAVVAGWVKEPEWVVNGERDDVASLLPLHVKWYAKKIDALYMEFTKLPPE